jgi:hypothetical protein
VFLRWTLRFRDRESNSKGSTTVAVAPDLGMAFAQRDRQPVYLRTFFRLLYSWVPGEKSWSRFAAPRSLLLASP